MNPTNYNTLQHFIQHLSYHFQQTSTHTHAHVCTHVPTHVRPIAHICMHTGKAFRVQKRKYGSWDLGSCCACVCCCFSVLVCVWNLHFQCSSEVSWWLLSQSHRSVRWKKKRKVNAHSFFECANMPILAVRGVLSICSLQKENWKFCFPVLTASSKPFALVASLQSCSCHFVFICCRCLFFAPGAVAVTLRSFDAIVCLFFAPGAESGAVAVTLCSFDAVVCFFAPGAESGAEASLLQPVVVRGAGPDGGQQRCHHAAAAASEPQPHPLLLCQLATIPSCARHHQVPRSACSAPTQ